MAVVQVGCCRLLNDAVRSTAFRIGGSQQSGDLFVPLLQSDAQRSPAVVALHLLVRAVSQQQFDRFRVAPQTGFDQRGRTVHRLIIRRRAGLQQNAHDLDISGHRGEQLTCFLNFRGLPFSTQGVLANCGPVRSIAVKLLILNRVKE